MNNQSYFILFLLFFFTACQANDSIIGNSPELTPAPMGVLLFAADTAVPAATSPEPPQITLRRTANLLPSFSNPLTPQLVETAALDAIQLVQLTPGNTAIWQFPAETFPHPIAAAINADTIFLIDNGRLLEIPREKPKAIRSLLQPGMLIEKIPVQELIDLQLTATMIFVLDRAGDVYSYNIEGKIWSIDKYDRPVTLSSGHYSAAITAGADGRYLLDLNYGYMQLYGGPRDRLWYPPKGENIDLTVIGSTQFLLQEDRISKYEDARLMPFTMTTPISNPLAILSTDEALYLLDYQGRRLLQLSPENGRSQSLFQLPPGSSVAAVADESFLIAGADQLYFFNSNEPAKIIDQINLSPRSPQPDWDHLLTPFQPPIVGSKLTERSLQMPGAPRHYRLGVHKGVDLYWAAGTPVRAIGAGIVIRVDHQYEPGNRAQFQAWRTAALIEQQTPADALDFYRGRQVWLAHPNGVISRYAHLSHVNPQLIVGEEIAAGTMLGRIGNSGSPATLTDPAADAHLHLELWVNENYLGQFLRPIESRQLLELLWP